MANRSAVIVTGASSGIGKACALRLDALGYDVFATYLHDEGAQALAREASNRLVPLPLDLTQEDSIREATTALETALGGKGLAGLINNAGIVVPGPLEFLPLDQLRMQFEVNVVGQVAMTQACLPLIRQGKGRIIYIGSIDGKCVNPFQGAYGASKHAIEAIADALRMELLEWRIPVSVIEPGDIATPLWHKSMALADRMLQQLPGEAQRLYGPTMAAARATAEAMEKEARPPAIVVNAVLHALTARRPKPRYLVGRDAQIRRALGILPTFVLDRLIMGLIKRGNRQP